MPQPAARLGDSTSHLFTPLTPSNPPGGSPNVRIGGQPAWRAVADIHSCPLSSPNPHVGGIVKQGSGTVRINNFQAARLGDTVTEVPGGENAIVFGCFTVLIGD